MRSRKAWIFACCIAVVGLFGPSVHSEEADESEVLKDGYRLTRNIRPAMCLTLLAQARALHRENKTLCELPLDSDNGRIKTVHWEPVDPDSVEEDLAANLPFTGFDANQLHRKLMAAEPIGNWHEITKRIWAAEGPEMMNALRRDPSYVATATLDVDGDGVTERVYRTVVLSRVLDAQSNSTWRPYLCTQNGEKPESPHYAITFEPSARLRLGTLAQPNSLTASELILFRGRIHSMLRSTSGTYVSEHLIVPGQNTAFRNVVCYIANY